MTNSFLLAFIPILVAVDPIGILPAYMSLTQGLDPRIKRKVVFQSLVTALCLALGFVWLGKRVFSVLGINVSDFMIAGGTILFCIAVLDLLKPGQQKRAPEDDDPGVVPIGTPLIAGPAVLTTSLMVVDQFGAAITVMAVLANILIVGFVLNFSEILIRILGVAGSRALSKVMALLLAAIAVMMIRKGIFQIIMQ